MSELEDWMREPDFSEDFSMEECIDWIERRPIKELAALQTNLAEAVREREDYNGKHQIAVMAIDKLRKRVAVLEMVIMEELDDCQHEANQMIVDSIREKMSL